MLYADFESFCLPVEEEEKVGKRETISRHFASGFSIRTCAPPSVQHLFPMINYRERAGNEDETQKASYRFCSELWKISQRLDEVLQTNLEMKKLTPSEQKSFDRADQCSICNKKFQCPVDHAKWTEMMERIKREKNRLSSEARWGQGNWLGNLRNRTEEVKLSREEAICLEILRSNPTAALGAKVRDHDHWTGNFRGAAHSKCNLLYHSKPKVSVFFHNATRYDNHLILGENWCRLLGDFILMF